MDSYIVRIYRRKGARPEELAGVVEDVANGESRSFTTAAELCSLLEPEATKKAGRLSIKPGPKKPDS